MSTAIDSLTVVATVPEEVSAAAIVALLAEHGIKAIATGGTTAGFRAEAPGQVQVLVAESDHSRASAILDRQRSQIEDWEQEEIGRPEEEAIPHSSHILQSRFWRYFTVTIVCLVLLGLFSDAATIVLEMISRIVS